MQGRYENFPETIHGIARVSCRSSRKTLQRLVASAISQINNRRFELEDVALPTSPNCSVDFEFGIGEDSDFNFFDNAEFKRLQREIKSEKLRLVDFLCVLQYYRFQEPGVCTPLKADYYMLRFVFGTGCLDILAYHERGPRRVHVEDLIRFLVKHAALRARHSPISLKLEKLLTV